MGEQLCIQVGGAEDSLSDGVNSSHGIEQGVAVWNTHGARWNETGGRGPWQSAAAPSLAIGMESLEQLVLGWVSYRRCLIHRIILEELIS